MKNSYKIFSKHSLNKEINLKTLKKACVIAHLFYDDKFDNSMSYLLNIPKEVDVYIVTANQILSHIARQFFMDNSICNFNVIEKPNRGRDYAALFVTSKNILEKYEYICFIHDKKSHAADEIELGDSWGKCLFESTLASKEYVYNIISCFENEKELGILSAPIPPEDYLLGLRGSMWTTNYSRSLALLEKIGVETIPNQKNDPITIGSAFWFRKQSLDKLINYGLKYDDFPEEPMPNDGTLAHVLERILATVSEEAGFRNYYVLNDKYAEYYISLNIEYLTKAIKTLSVKHALRFRGNHTDMDLTYQNAISDYSPNEFKNYCRGYRRICLIEEKNSLSIKNCQKELKDLNVSIKGIYYYPEFDGSVVSNKDYGIIICSDDNTQEIKDALKQFDRCGFTYRGMHEDE